MEIADLVRVLKEKVIQGEYGPWKRPYVVLDIEEYQAILEKLEAKPKRGRPKKVKDVPLEATR